MINQVVTRWYRAPELLYGARMYGPGVDVWAVGCILAELLLRVALFPGDTDLDQMSKIFQVTGTPDETTWPGVSSLPDFITFKPMPGTPLQHIFTAADDDLIHVMQSMLALDPNNRLDCDQLLRQPFFSNLPAPTAPHKLPMPGSANPAGDVARSKRMGDTMMTGKRLQFD